MRSYCFACFCLCTFSSSHMATTTTTPKMLCSTLHTHAGPERDSLSRAASSFSWSLVFVLVLALNSNWLSLSPSNSGFLLRSLNFCCLRSVQLLTSRLWVRNRLKGSAARACFQINLIIRTSLVVAALPLRCCCTCCCRVCHSQNSIRLNF